MSNYKNEQLLHSYLAYFQGTGPEPKWMKAEALFDGCSIVKELNPISMKKTNLLSVC